MPRAQGRSGISRLILSLACFVSWGTFVRAQPPAPTAPPPVEVPLVTVEPAQPQLLSLAPRNTHLWETDVLVGLPTGVRFQKPSIFFDQLRFEAFGGLFAIFPSLGAGYRLNGHLVRGDCDDLSISPGIDAYVLFNPFSRHSFFGGGPDAVGLVAFDVDVQWRHYFSDRFVGVTGVKLGAGVGGVGFEHWLPVFGFTVGFQF